MLPAVVVAYHRLAHTSIAGYNAQNQFGDERWYSSGIREGLVPENGPIRMEDYGDSDRLVKWDFPRPT